MTTDFESTITVDVAALDNDIRIIDFMDGSVYRLPDNMIEDLGHNVYRLKNIPIKDYPMAITFCDFADVE